jgi:hypothetical protein
MCTPRYSCIGGQGRKVVLDIVKQQDNRKCFPAGIIFLSSCKDLPEVLPTV